MPVLVLVQQRLRLRRVQGAANDQTSIDEVDAHGPFNEI